jgi:polysaccharide biosynthesis transport protein
MEPKDIVNAIKKRIGWIILFPLVCTIAMFFITKKMPKKYKSYGRISTGITESVSVSLSETKDNDQPFKIAQKFSNIMEIMRTREVVEQVQYRLILHDLTSAKPFCMVQDTDKFIQKEDKIKYAKILENINDSLISLDTKNKYFKNVNDLVYFFGYTYESVAQKISFRRLPDTDFISLECETESPNLSAFLVNIYIEEFIRFYKKQKTEQSEGSVNFFERLAKLKKKELDSKVNELKTFKLKNRVINLYEQTKSVVNQLSSIELSRQQENGKIPSLTKAIDDISQKFESKDKLFYEAVNAKTHQKIDSLKEKLTNLNSRHLEEGKKDPITEDSIASIRKEMDVLIDETVNEGIINPNAVRTELVSRKLNAEIDLEIAIKTVGSIDEEIVRLQTIITSFAPMEASIGAIEREITVASEVYLLVLNKWNAAQFAALSDGDNLKQTEIGLPAERPESTKRMMILGLTLAISLVFMCAWAILSDFSDASFRNTERFEKFTELKTIASLVKLPSGNLNFAQLFDEKYEPIDFHLFATEIRRIRQTILNQTNHIQSIAFVSTAQSEGKSFLMMALAFSLGMIKKKILIIDCNLKNNLLTSFLHPNPENVSSSTEIVASKMNFVDLIGSQKSSLTPLEAMPNVLNKAFLADLKNKYDYILIETPAINQFADTNEILAHVDSFISVFAAQNKLTDTDKLSLQFIKQNSHQHIGSILNKIELEEMVAEKMKKGFLAKFLKKKSKKVSTNELTIQFNT